jgi:hypothetical protein
MSFLRNHWYSGHVISRGELNIDHANMEAILKWQVPSNVTKIRRFVGVSQYLMNFIASFLVVFVPLHVKSSGKSFKWENNQ